MPLPRRARAPGRPGAARTPADGAGAGITSRPWLSLTFVCIAQLMIILDITIVNIALPSAQRDLGVADGDRQWVITTYSLAFGSLLLLGGRIADRTGRRRAFMVGLAGFAGASALGGAAPTFGTLLAARGLQGAFAALLAPAILSLIAVIFTRPADRATAFGVFGAISAGGGALGLVFGGLLTEYLDWRWCLYVNLPIAVVAAGAWYVLPADRRAGERARFDLPGVVLATSGLLAVVYGCGKAETAGWDSGIVITFITAGVVLLAVFAFVESRTRHPLLPLRVVLSRTRGSAYLAVGLGAIGVFGTFLYLTYFMQIVLGYSALKTGLAFLPMTAGVLVSAGGLASRLLPRVRPRVLIVPGFLIATGALAWLSAIGPDSSYATLLLPAMTTLGFGMGLVWAPSMNYATYDVEAHDAGVASASVTTMQQIGGSLGTALLNTIATSTAADHLAGRAPSAATARAGMAHGFSVGFGWAAVIAGTAALVVLVLMNTPRPLDEPDDDRDAAVPAHFG